jgi:hypothetical protein
MKLNFWQWLAIALLIIGCAVWLFERSHPVAAAPTVQSGLAATQPVVAR